MLKNFVRPVSLSSCALGLTISASALGLCAASSAATESIHFQLQDGLTLKVVASAKTLVRCGDQDVFYAIAELSANTPLQAAGVSGAYTKVLLPTSIGAFVPANEVGEVAGGSVTLKMDSKLRAPSHLLGLSGSWKALYTTALPAGTSLKVIESLKGNSGDIVGYRVEAPKGQAGELPIAYVRTDALRDATPAELSAFESGTLTTSSTKPTTKPTTKPAVKPDPTQPQIEERPRTQPPVAEQPAQEVDTSLMEEMDVEGSTTSQPVEIQNITPVDEGSREPATQPTEITAPAGLVSSSALEDLESTFTRARSATKSELDEALDELLAEFSRTREEAEEGTSLARALDQRIEWINIRIETRDQRLAIAQTLAQHDANADQLTKQIEQWQQGRAYQLVGRMVTSSVYTGEKLPLLYRVQSRDPMTGAVRTIGYVAPQSDQDFRHLLGRVVGIVGSKHVDPSLKLTVIEPDRIDPMPE